MIVRRWVIGLLVCVLFIAGCQKPLVGKAGEMIEEHCWVSLPHPFSTEKAGDIFFTSPQEGWFSARDQLAHSLDGGLTWSVKAVPPADSDFNHVYFYPTGSGWLVSGGQLYQSLNQGDTWTLKRNFDRATSPRREITFVDMYWAGNTGILAGNVIEEGLNGAVLEYVLIARTTNGGTSWSEIKPSFGSTESKRVTDIFFSSASTGYVVGSGSSLPRIAKTIDGGVSWSNLVIPSTITGVFSGIHFAGDVGLLYGASMTLKTLDGGSTWEVVSSAGSAIKKGIVFDSSRFMVGTTTAGVKVTSDGGIQWTSAIPDYNGFVYDLAFLDSSKGWAVGSSSIYRADVCIADADSDGVSDAIDNCPAAVNVDQADADGDGVGDVCDNCPSTANADQADAGGDGVGDACPVCGDNLKEPLEECEDGNIISADGCNVYCEVESGWECPGGLSCNEICGDGQIVGGEVCDDDNTLVGDGCSAVCEVELGYTCSNVPSVCITTCGDGVRAGTETCDDGNGLAGDGCSPLCELEEVGGESLAGESGCTSDAECDGRTCSSGRCVAVLGETCLLDTDCLSHACNTISFEVPQCVQPQDLFIFNIRGYLQQLEDPSTTIPSKVGSVVNLAEEYKLFLQRVGQ